jgi:choloylglycine hydrolase
MCTSVFLSSGFFGRTLDYEHSFDEEILLSPRTSFRLGEAYNRYAALGIGVMRDNTPLYFDGMNEFGLCAAALNFPGEACYSEGEGLHAGNLIGFVLGFCRSTDEARGAIEKLGIVGSPEDSPLHWMIADKRSAIVVESTKRGLLICDNTVGVLTNSPDFKTQLSHLSDFSNLSARSSSERGDGAVGLPGDFTSMSRFVRASFLRENSISDGSSEGELCRLCHILDCLSLPYGVSRSEKGEPISTRYTSYVDMENLTYYYKTYNSHGMKSMKLNPELTEHKEITTYPLYDKKS